MAEQLTDAQRQRFQRLMWPLIPVVLRFGKFLTHRQDDAEDLAQETMMRAMRHIDRFEEGTDAKAWLLTIERRLWIDRRRAKKNQPMASLDADDAPEPAAGATPGVHDHAWEQPQDLLNRFGDQELINALQALPDEIRWTLLLVDVEGVDYAEAAAILDVPVGTIKSRTHRGRGMLRDRLYERAREQGWLRGGARNTP